MERSIYTITKTSLEKMGNALPDYVRKKAGSPGCYTLGAVVKEGDRETLAGVCQFLVNKVSDSRIAAELVYAYVYEAYRRKGIGLLLSDRMTGILKKSGVSSCLTILVGDEADILGYGLKFKELEQFLKEVEYRPIKENSELWEKAQRDMFAGIPDMIVTNSHKYIKRII